MSISLVDKLLESFDELERCIRLTKEILLQKEGVPNEVLSRVDQYAAIVLKQRGLANTLREHIELQNWEEVSRHVKLINGLSSMIRDDAQAILSGAYGQAEEANPLRKVSQQILC